MEAEVILVNSEDKEIGTEKKLIAHQYAMLHRAFSVLVFSEHNGKKELLLQQRSKKKYHCGGLWTNSCCSHPAPGEKLISAARQRLHFEMGIDIPLEEKGSFHYVAVLDNNLYENEIDHVLLGFYDKAHPVPFNRDEVETCRWITLEALQQDLKTHPLLYTPWLKQALKLAI